MKEKFVKAIETEYCEILVTKVIERDTRFDQNYSLEFTELQQDPDGNPTAINEGIALVWKGGSGGAVLIFAGVVPCDMRNVEERMAAAGFSSNTISKLIETIKKLVEGDENI